MSESYLHPSCKAERRVRVRTGILFVCFASFVVSSAYWKIKGVVPSRNASSVLFKPVAEFEHTDHATNSWPRIWCVVTTPTEKYIRLSRNNTNELDFDNQQLGSTDADIQENTQKGENSSCHYYADWHFASYPTCNKIHEIDFVADTHDTVEYLTRGGKRLAWKVRQNIQNTISNIVHPLDGKAGNTVVFKNLRYKSDVLYDESTMEKIRYDAMISEKLSASPYIIGIYGFCGETVINEFGNGGPMNVFISKSKQKNNVTTAQRHVFARDVAFGMADIHEMTREGNLTTIIHQNMKPSNILLSDGKLKIHDFDDASILKWDAEKNERCGFLFRSICIPKYIEPPEECIIRNGHSCSEKTEVLKLGLIFHYILTGKSPGTKGLPILEYPDLKLPEIIQKSQDRSIKAISEALLSALTFEEDKRPSAMEIATFLDKSYNKIYG